MRINFALLVLATAILCSCQYKDESILVPRSKEDVTLADCANPLVIIENRDLGVKRQVISCTGAKQNTDLVSSHIRDILIKRKPATVKIVCPSSTKEVVISEKLIDGYKKLYNETTDSYRSMMRESKTEKWVDDTEIANSVCDSVRLN